MILELTDAQAAFQAGDRGVRRRAGRAGGGRHRRGRRASRARCAGGGRARPDGRDDPRGMGRRGPRLRQLRARARSARARQRGLAVIAASTTRSSPSRSRSSAPTRRSRRGCARLATGDVDRRVRAVGGAGRIGRGQPADRRAARRTAATCSTAARSGSPTPRPRTSRSSSPRRSRASAAAASARSSCRWTRRA